MSDRTDTGTTPPDEQRLGAARLLAYYGLLLLFIVLLKALLGELVSRYDLQQFQNVNQSVMKALNDRASFDSVMHTVFSLFLSLVFTLPLDGDREVPSDSRFVVQFSKDMDESSFAGHVVVRYVGPRLPGDREFDGVRLTYDGGRRALTVDPGDVLRTGRRLEVVLLPGITDMDGLTLEPRPGTPPLQGVVDVVSYEIGG